MVWNPLEAGPCYKFGCKLLVWWVTPGSLQRKEGSETGRKESSRRQVKNPGPPGDLWATSQDCPIEGRGACAFIHRLLSLLDGGSLLGP